jgi:hypothetical protein
MNFQRGALAACVLGALANAYFRTDIGRSSGVLDTPRGRWIFFVGILLIVVTMWKSCASEKRPVH